MPNASALAEKHRQEAEGRALSLAPIVLPMVERGLSLSEIARSLNDRGIAAARGGMFHAQQVKNLIRFLPVR